MPIQQEVVLTDQEKEIIQEVQKLMGFQTMEQTIQYLAKSRIQELLAKLTGDELSRNCHYF